MTWREPPSPLAVTLTVDELRLLVASAVAEAMASGAAPPRLLDRERLGAALGCSTAMVDKLRRAGLPSVYVGDSPRFDIEDCLAWLRARPPPM
jgi:hypothetical protein